MKPDPADLAFTACDAIDVLAPRIRKRKPDEGRGKDRAQGA